MKLQQLAEEKVGFLIVFTLLVVSIGLLVEVVPLFAQKEVITPAKGVKPYTALQVAGRDIYVREGCYNCHSQQIRPFRAETERYGHYSVAGESVYDHPFQWGSKRTGPDLARVGGRYGDDWHHRHLTNPRSVVPESNMPSYPWLNTTPADITLTEKSIRTKMKLGEPYTEADVASVKDALKDKTEMDALVAYLQGLGVAFKEQKR